MSALPKYLLYATLLDTYEGYINSSRIYQTYWGFSIDPPKTEEEFEKEQFQSLIDRINRVPFDSEPADRGTSFNEVIDCIITKSVSEKVQMKSDKQSNTITVNYNNRTFVFPLDQCLNVAKGYQGAVPQVLTKGHLETKYGLVELYGYIDELMPLQIVDIKTTSKYSAFKFKDNWQHKVYPYCLSCEGINIPDFTYDVYVMNKSNSITESHQEFYSFVPERDIPSLINHCEGMIEFIETNRHLITDKKIFNEHE